VRIGLIVAADEPAIFFPNIESAEQWMEPVDVIDGIYTAAYGPCGEPYLVETDGLQVAITRAPNEPDRPEELRALLMRFFEAVGEPAGADEDLSTMLARCRPTYGSS
jgi:hypothetical protein